MGREMDWGQVRSDVREIGELVRGFALLVIVLAVIIIAALESSGGIDLIPTWAEYLAQWAVRVLLILGLWLFLYERWTEEGDA